MPCVNCGANYNKVSNSRDTIKGTQIWRRRQCLSCNVTFTTYEMVDLSYLKVIKKSGKVQKFIPVKIYAGLLQACLYSKRSDKGHMAVFAKKLSDEILLEIARLQLRKIASQKIKDIALKVLYKRSPETFLRYLSYVTPLESTNALRRELNVFVK